MSIYRAGWPSTVHPASRLARTRQRVGFCWVWIGPYMIGWRIP